MKRGLVLIAVMLFTGVTNAGALNLTNSHLYRFDIRGDDGGDYYFVNLALTEKKNIDFIKRDLTFGAFVEGSYSFDAEDFTMSKAGVLGSVKLIDKLSWKKDFYYVEAKEEFIWRNKLTYSIPFEIFNLNPSLNMFEEFRFNLTEGEGSRNDAGVGISVPITDMIKYYLGFRHTDRIHFYDTDYIENMLTFTF